MRDYNNSLWLQIQKGDKEAFSKLFKEYYLYLYNYGRKLYNDGDVVEDALQDIFTRIWQTKERLSNINNIRSYLVVSLRRHLLLLIKKENKNQHSETLLVSQKEEEPDIYFTEQEIVINPEGNKELRKALVEAINKLPAQKKEVIYLHFFNGMDYEEISEIMGLGIPTVRNYMSTALYKLKKNLISGKIPHIFLFLIILFIFSD